tara:strand:- start:3899 stop:5062 length:1164 start_codon:yes stop_codon:yes gene_type:complete
MAANWRKVLVSGSDASLNSIGVGSAIPSGTSGQISASGKLFALTTLQSGVATYNVVIKGPNGEFMHTGSDSISPTLQNLTLGTGLTGGTYNGSSAITTTLDSASLAGNGLVAGAAGENNINVGAGNNITVSSTALSVDSASLVDTARGLEVSPSSANKIAVSIDNNTITFDGSGQIQAGFIAGAALSAGDGIDLSTNPYTGGGTSTVSVDVTDLVGTGLSEASNNLQIKNVGSLSDNTLLKWNNSLGQFENSSIVEGTNLLTLGGTSTNVIIPGDLIVQGTASFTNAQNLAIADPFILLNSGSTSDEASGIIGAISSTLGIGWTYGGSSDKRFSMITGSVLAQGGTNGGKVGGASLLVNSTNTSEGNDYMAQTGNFLVASDEIYVYF